MTDYPPTKDLRKIGTYPSLIPSGGGFLYDKVLEYRVWVHPKNGDNFYKAFATYKEAESYSSKTPGAESPLVLVLQKKGHWASQKENVVAVGEEDRITEWYPEWLPDRKYSEARLRTILRKRPKKTI